MANPVNVRPIDDWRLNARADLFDAQAPVAAAQWPPNSIWERIQYLDELRAAYDGDTRVDDLGQPVNAGATVRWCHWAATKYGRYLTASPPKLRGENVTSAVMQAVVDMVRYGGALIWPDGDDLLVLDPRFWIPGSEADWTYLVPQVSRTSRVVDRCVLWVYAAGRLTVSEHPFTGAAGSDSLAQSIGGSIDLTQSAPVTVGEDGAPGSVDASELLVVPCPPARGEYWGTSIIEAGAPWQAEAQMRWAGIRALSDKIEEPLLTYRAADNDMREIVDESYDPDSFGDDVATRNETASDALKRFTAQRTLRLPDAVQDVSYVQPSYDAGAIEQVLENCRREFEAATFTTGLTMAAASDAGMSGTAIKWSNADALAAAASIKTQLTAALEHHFGQGSVEWDDPIGAVEPVLADAPPAALEPDDAPTPPSGENSGADGNRGAL